MAKGFHPISEFKKGHKGGMTGKKFSKESREKMRLSHLGNTMTSEQKEALRLRVKKEWDTGVRKGGWKISEEGRKNIGKAAAIFMKGKKMSESTKEKLRKYMTGRRVGKNHPSFGTHPSKETLIKMSESRKGKRTGESNPRWKGGITPLNMKIRNSPDGVLWRKSVFIRDNFTCQKYGVKGGKLVAHHINNFADFPELRFAIDNGITLSLKAHKEFHHIYGNKNNTREQLLTFLNKNYVI